MKRSSGQNSAAILHDAYFNRPPSLIRLLLIRLILLCALSASTVWCLTDLYLILDEQLPLCLAAAGISAALFILASLLPSWAVYLTFSAGLGIFACIAHSSLAAHLSFFWDKLMLRLDSRLLATKPLLFHSYGRLKGGYYDEKLADGWLVGMILLICVISLIFTVCSRTRFRPFPVFLVFGALSAPAFAAEIGGFRPSMLAFVPVFFALFAVNSGYELDGRMVFGKSRAAKEAVRRNEHAYRRRTRFFLAERKLKSDLPRYFKYNANSLLALLVSAGVLLGAASLVPDGQGFDYEAFFSSVQEAGVAVADRVGGFLGVTFGSVDDSGYFSYSDYGDDSGGIGIGEPSARNLPVIDVLLDRNDIPVYLRGDIGVDYTGSSWTAIRDEYKRFRDGTGISYEEKLGGFYTDVQYQVLRQRLSSLGYNPDRLFPLQNVSLTYRRNTKVVFQPLAPYELNFGINENFESFGDYVLRTRSGKGYLKTFESLSLTPFMDNSYMPEAITSAQYSADLSWTLPDGMSSAEYSEYIKSYRSFVTQAYMRSDPSIYGLISEMERLGYIGGLSDFDTASGICRYFKENFTYSLNAENGPIEKSLENFLYDTKQGHCALFATAMTLAMRELGVPARYVTGYVASGAGEQTAEGRYLYTLKENDLHAWVEVYFDNAGWLPFDPTAAVSGFSEGADDGQGETGETDPADTADTEITEPEPVTTEPPATVTETSGVQPEETTAPEDSESTSASHTQDGEEATTAESEPPDLPPSEHSRSLSEIISDILPYLTFGAITAAVIALAVLFARGVNEAEKKALRGFRKKPPDKAVGEMYRLAMLLLAKEGLSPGAETLTEYAVRADASPVLKGANVFMTDVMPLFMKCEFGKPEISPIAEEERLAAVKFTLALYRRVMEKKNAFGRFFAKISLFL